MLDESVILPELSDLELVELISQLQDRVEQLKAFAKKERKKGGMASLRRENQANLDLIVIFQRIQEVQFEQYQRKKQ